MIASSNFLCRKRESWRPLHSSLPQILTYLSRGPTGKLQLQMNLRIRTQQRRVRFTQPSGLGLGTPLTVQLGRFLQVVLGIGQVLGRRSDADHMFSESLVCEGVIVRQSTPPREQHGHFKVPQCNRVTAVNRRQFGVQQCVEMGDVGVLSKQGMMCRNNNILL